MIEDDADEQERAAAEALARALEGDGAAQAVSESASGDALETAALLRAAASKDELSATRSDAIYAALGGDIERHVRPQRARNALGIGVAALAAAAAVALYLGTQRHEAARDTAQHATAAIARLPAPPPSLLAAQAALGSRGAQAQANETFEHEMRAYRTSVLDKLKQSYPATVGMLEPRRRP